MRDKNLTATFSAGVRSLLAMVFVFSQSVWAVDNPKAQDKAGSSAAAQPAADKPSSPSAKQSTEPASNGGRQEGIKVHGHWTIEVRNPDGTVVTHREFENALISGDGNAFLAQILGRQNTVGAWQVLLLSSIAGEPYLNSIIIDEPGSTLVTGSAEDCSSVTGNGSSCSTNLAVTAAGGTVTLTGSGVVPPTFGSNVGQVFTFVTFCAATSTAATCPTSQVTGAPPKDYFTTRALDGVGSDPSPVPVSPGQTVAVTVIFSFS